MFKYTFIALKLYFVFLSGLHNYLLLCSHRYTARKLWEGITPMHTFVVPYLWDHDIFLSQILSPNWYLSLILPLTLMQALEKVRTGTPCLPNSWSACHMTALLLVQFWLGTFVACRSLSVFPYFCLLSASLQFTTNKGKCQKITLRKKKKSDNFSKKCYLFIYLVISL